MNSHRSIGVITLGCKLNFAESSAIAQQFVKNGYIEVGSADFADVYLVNTCTVTEHSDKKCRNLIRKAHRINPNALIIVTGCYAELKREEIAKIEGVTCVVAQSDKAKIYNIVSNLLKQSTDNSYSNNLNIFPAASYGERTRSFLKIQDGCDYFCTYCAIPFARGRSRAVPLETILSLASELAAKGIKEIVLTGINIGDYSRVSGNITLLELLKQLNDIKGIERYRISSIEPNLITPEIVDWIASGTKFQPHFHIPLQSGSDSVLLRMKRRYTTQLFRERIDYIRDKMGDLFLGIDVIVGFPQESESEFDETYNFLSQQIKPSFLHIFPYSKREGTLAFKMKGQVDERIKSERVALLEQLSDKLYNDYSARFKGTTQKVLFESNIKNIKGNRVMEGYTGNYIKVIAPYNPNMVGKICEIVL